MDTDVEEFMLTTVDNPYDPFTDFNEWKAFDERKGYYSTELLARVVKTSDDMSEADQHLAINYAVDEIVKENVSGVHRKVSRTEKANADE